MPTILLEWCGIATGPFNDYLYLLSFVYLFLPLICGHRPGYNAQRTLLLKQTCILLDEFIHVLGLFTVVKKTDMLMIFFYIWVYFIKFKLWFTIYDVL